MSILSYKTVIYANSCHRAKFRLIYEKIGTEIFAAKQNKAPTSACAETGVSFRLQIFFQALRGAILCIRPRLNSHQDEVCLSVHAVNAPHGCQLLQTYA